LLNSGEHYELVQNISECYSQLQVTAEHRKEAVSSEHCEALLNTSNTAEAQLNAPK
jgi:hypothetical protein